MDIITSTKGCKNNTLGPLTKKRDRQVYSLQKCFFPHFLDWNPALDIGIAKSGSNLVHSHPSHILCLKPYVKARKSFPCLVMMHHQTNLDCKSFSISEDLVETIVFDLEHSKMIFLNDALADDDASQYQV